MRLVKLARRTGTCTTPLHQPDKAEHLIVGYTTKDHLILDLDKAHSLPTTVKLIRIVQQEYPDVGDCLISESSWDGFHCIFDNRLPWYRIMHICRTLQGLNVLNRDYIKVRTFREDLTLRVSSIDRGYEKSEAPIPVTVVLNCNSALAWQTGEPKIRTDALMMYYGEYRDVLFSGIYDYLMVLSTFRRIENLSVQIA